MLFLQCQYILCCCFMSHGVEMSHDVKISQIVVLCCGLMVSSHGIVPHGIICGVLWSHVLCNVQLKKSKH